jgi:hypothetical protein
MPTVRWCLRHDVEVEPLGVGDYVRCPVWGCPEPIDGWRVVLLRAGRQPQVLHVIRRRMIESSSVPDDNERMLSGRDAEGYAIGGAIAWDTVRVLTDAAEGLGLDDDEEDE